MLEKESTEHGMKQEVPEYEERVAKGLVFCGGDVFCSLDPGKEYNI